MAAGVLSGLGHFFGVDPTWLRIAYAVATIFTAIIPGIAVYAILALVIPADTPDNGRAWNNEQRVFNWTCVGGRRFGLLPKNWSIPVFRRLLRISRSNTVNIAKEFTSAQADGGMHAVRRSLSSTRARHVCEAGESGA